MFKKLKTDIGLKGHIHIKAWEKCPIGISENLVYEHDFDNLIVWQRIMVTFSPSRIGGKKSINFIQIHEGGNGCGVW